VKFDLLSAMQKRLKQCARVVFVVQSGCYVSMVSLNILQIEYATVLNTIEAR